MKLTCNIIAAMLIIFGGVFALQGANVLLGSVMSGDHRWLYTGTAMVIIGAGLVYWANFRGRRR